MTESGPYNVAVIGPCGHGKTMLAACLVHAQPQTGARDPVQALVAHSGGYHGRWSGFPPANSYDHRSVRPTPFRFATAARVYTGFDCPGLATLARRSSSLLTAMDAVIVVVSPLELDGAALESLGEQLSVAHHMGVTSVIGFLNKCDHFESLGDRDEVCGDAEARVRRAAHASGFIGERIAFARGAAGPEVGGDPRFSGAATDVASALDACSARPRSPDAPLMFPVLRAHRIAGRGSVAAGILARGRIAEGDRVRVLGARRSWFNRHVATTAFDSEVLSLREFDQPRGHAEAGAAIGALLRPRNEADWQAAYEICHGVTIVGRGADATTRFAGRFRFIGPPGTTHRASAAHLFYAGMGREAGALELASDRSIDAGEVVQAVVTLAMPMYLEVGMRLFVRRDRIAALGEVTSLAP